MITGGAQVVSILCSLLVDADFYCQMTDQIETLKKAGTNGRLTLPAIMPPPVYSAIVGDRYIDLENCTGLGDEEYRDPYNRATAAYYGTGDYRVDFECDLPYEDGSIRGIVHQLTQPVRYFIRRVIELIHHI